MRLYLDDDTTSGKLIQILRRDGHDVQIPLDVGLSGDSDAVHQTHAIRDNRVLMTYNCDDFNHLHLLIAESGGSHPGFFHIRKDNDPRRDMAPYHIALAIKKLFAERFGNCQSSCHLEPLAMTSAPRIPVWHTRQCLVHF